MQVVCRERANHIAVEFVRVGRDDTTTAFLSAGDDIWRMSLQHRLREWFRPWYALVFAVFVAGTAWSLRGQPLGLSSILIAVTGGLLGAVVFQFTVGSVWAYIVEYANAGGRWTDGPFLAPFTIGIATGAVTYVYDASVGAAAWAAFWSFAVSAAALAVIAQFYAGYRESSA
ncbi:hypothetical protein C455_12163 [Haloferax larsenii JCM 13917]|nr:hypothetical protein C455_12163 [Haloferax larsenii JCM 13917]